MANRQGFRTSHSYQNTIYALSISRLASLGTNPNSEPVNCPKVGCKTKLFRTQQLYRHIETKHPEEKRHTRNYSTNILSTSSSLSPSISTETPNIDNVALSSEDEEMDFSNNDYEEMPFFSTSESFVDDYLNDEYLKVCN